MRRRWREIASRLKEGDIDRDNIRALTDLFCASSKHKK